MKRNLVFMMILVAVFYFIHPGPVGAETIKAELFGRISYIQGLQQNLYFGAAVSGLLDVNDPVSMQFEFDPAAGVEAANYNTTRIFKGAIADWSIDFNNQALVIEHDPTVTTQTVNKTLINSDPHGQSYFTTWDYDLTGASGSIQAPEFASVSPYDSNWVPWQIVLFFAPPTTNMQIPDTPDFLEMRFDYVAHRPSLSNPSGTNVQSGIYVTWDSYKFDTDPPAPVPEPGTILLLGSGLVGLAVVRRRKKS